MPKELAIMSNYDKEGRACFLIVLCETGGDRGQRMGDDLTYLILRGGF